MAHDRPVRVAVLTGGHAFDVPGFHDLFRRLPGIVADIQSVGDFAASPRGVRRAYDVVLCYGMLLDTPKDDDQPWYEGKQLTALSELGETHQGLVVLHHALLAYPQWPVWDEIIGIRGRRDIFRFTDACTLRVQIAGPDHPIAAGLAPWEMVDETYVVPEPGADSEVLLTTDHPDSMRALAWVRTYRNARVFCYQSGHGPAAYGNAQFQQVLARGLGWVART